MKRTLCLSLLAVGAAAHAQQYAVVPKPYANTAASTSGFNVLLSNSERTGQMLINANQLSDVSVGSLITGLTFRLYTGSTAAFPTAALAYSDYSIAVGQSIAPNDVHLDGFTTTFADNFVGTPTTVRSGALSLAANSFTRGATPNAWGYEISFQTPYVYNGGNLGIQISHSSRSGANPLLEIARTTDAGYAAGDYSFYYGALGSATGDRDAFTVARLSVAPVPEPATMAALGLGIAAFARRRRQGR